jgi:disulfide bond formation protein DsbB
MTALPMPGERLLALLNYLFMLAMLAVMSAVLIAAMTLQYAWGEIPCPLCLLQRVAMLGICFGILLNLRGPFSYQNTGISLLFALFLLVVSARQTLLDIYPRPGHEYVGSAVLGLHMPVWSVVISLCVLAAFAIKLAVLGGDDHLREHRAASFPLVSQAARILGVIVVAICAVNLVSAFVQCGFGQCHTMGYALLKSL